MGVKIISKNKKAFHNYFLKERIEAGIELQGTEVKSVRAGKVSLQESYVKIDEKGEAWIINMNIAHYEFGNRNNHEESRKRKLLLHKEEIVKLNHQIMAKRMTIVPVSIYFKNSKVKVEIAIAQGKQQHDKRQDTRKNEVKKKLRKGQYD